VQFTETSLSGAFVLDLTPIADARGFFARSFCQDELAAHGLNGTVAQENIAFNHLRGTVRGMHFQYPPTSESKLVRVTRGAVLDVIVDLRPESSTFLHHVSVELTAENRRALYVPPCFAHGYQALEDSTEAVYAMGAAYAPDLQGGLRFDDPRLGLSWPLPVTEISAKDQTWALLDEVEPELRRRLRR
jgi:dTDP-4-dehydrorhamnose 3,5-epimerase